LRDSFAAQHRRKKGHNYDNDGVHPTNISLANLSMNNEAKEEKEREKEKERERRIERIFEREQEEFRFLGASERGMLREYG